ncbi:MAG: hypothetical protein JWN86_676 [Planctomycetota bacterium]|nr:hypothetical protein [Planctomycetota bacterium]
MRRRLGALSLLSVLGLAIWGCGPPQVVPMTPPGIVYQKPPASEEMGAMGEVQSRATVQPANTAPISPSPSGTAPASGPGEKLGPLK